MRKCPKCGKYGETETQRFCNSCRTELFYPERFEKNTDTVIKPNNKLSVFHISIYLIIFFVLWSIRELIIRPVFLDSLDSIMFQATESAMKLLVWTLPAVLLIKYFQEDMWIGLKEMLTAKPKYFKNAPILLIVFVPLIRAGIFGEFAFNPDFEPLRLIGTVIFVGITEEVVFRGFLLNSTMKRMNLWSAIILNAVLFVLIHYPYWIYQELDIITFITGSVQVLLLSALFSYAFIKTKNIFVPITLHMIWNLLLVLFIDSGG